MYISSTTLLLILSSLGVIIFVVVDCSGVITLKQYSECKNLKMIKTLDFSNNTIYKPDPSITNNTLTDAYYQNFLGNLTWDKAMNLMARIYAERSSKNCTSEFCNCSRTLYDNFDADYGVLFRNKDMIEQVKRITRNFVNRFSNAYSDSYKSSLDWYIQRADLPTLSDFAINYEFSMARLMSYNFSVVLKEFSGYADRTNSSEVGIYFFIHT